MPFETGHILADRYRIITPLGGGMSSVYGAEHLTLNIPIVVKKITPKAIKDPEEDRKSTRLNSSHSQQSRMPSSA